MVWPWVVVGLFVVFLVVDVTVIFPRLVRRGQVARAANGGRHTVWWWISLGLVLAIGVVLLVVQSLR